MKVFNINKSIGRASSGVEYAQAYRYQLLAALSVKQVYVYTDFIFKDVIQFTNNIGIAKEDVIWSYTFLAKKDNAVCQLTVSAFEATLTEPFEKKATDKIIEYQLKNTRLSIKLELSEDAKVTNVIYYLKGKKTREVFYTDQICYETYFINDQKNHRVFYNQAQEKAFCQYYDETGKISATKFFETNELVFGEQGFLEKFFKALDFQKEDLVILDRNLGLAPAIFKQQNGATIAVVIHAEHFNKKRVYEDYILWNNYYEYVFTNHRLVDYFITATERQKQVLTEQFMQVFQQNLSGKIKAIPVGYVIETDVLPTAEHKFKLMTASRLADEKYVDYLIQAVTTLKEQYLELSFDIYGTGKNYQALEQLISQKKAENYIRLKGHQNLASVYQNYGVYLTASKSEGFGLSVLEALSNGLPVIGFDVEYGNQEFVKQNENGLLVPVQPEQAAIAQLTAGIDRFYKELDYLTASRCSKQAAEPFTFMRVKNKWQELLQEVANKTIEANRE